MYYRELTKLYFRDNSIVKHHIESYNKFIDEGMQRVIDNVGMIETNVEGFSIKLGRVKVERPKFYEVRSGGRYILPMEARWRNITYASPVYLEMTPVFNGVEKPTFAPVYIGDIPVMVGSKLCHLSTMTEREKIEAGEDPLDPGGYFIINGTERVLVSLEDLAPNRIITSYDKDSGEAVAKISSIRKGFRAQCSVRRTKHGKLFVDFPSSTPNLPLLPVIAVLLSEKSMEKAAEEVFPDNPYLENDLLYNLEQLSAIEDPIEYLANRLSPGHPKEYKLSRMEYLIDNHLLPHLGIEPKDRKVKAKYLAWMALRTTLVANKRMLPDDRDHYGNKRVKPAGVLMEELFRYAFQYLVKDIIYQASRAHVRGKKLQVHTLVRPTTFTDRILFSMATGNWIGGQTGVSQLMEKSSFLMTLSLRNRIISPLSKRHPHFKARDLHGTQFGRICPGETPEGPGTSLVKNKAVFATITVGVEKDEVVDALKGMGVKPVL